MNLIKKLLIFFVCLTGCANLSEPSGQEGASHDVEITVGEVKNTMIEENNAVQDLDNLTPLDADALISAEIVMVSASGEKVDLTKLITADNIEDFTPSPETVAELAEYFSSKKLDVLYVGGISMSVSGTAKQFAEVFNVEIFTDENQSIILLSEDENGVSQISTSALPDSIQPLISAIQLGSQPDFGPENFDQ